jgi:hypothetical protein
VVANQNQPVRGTVTDLINGLLDRGYNQQVGPVLEAIGRSTNSGLIARRLDELGAEAARLAEAGEKMLPDNAVLRAVVADLDDTMRANARLLDTVAEGVQGSGVQASGVVQRQLALGGMTDAQLARLGVVWNRPNPEAVARLVNYVQRDTWQALLRKYGDDVVGIVNNQAIRGVALGWGPLRTAREATRIAQALPRHQANNLLRTLQLTSYRDSTAAHQQANLHLAQQIIRIAALDNRTCLSCIAEHGTVLWDSERDVNAPVPRVIEHHSGRCSSVILVVGRPRAIQSGEDWFNALPPERQAQQNSFRQSPGKLEAFRNGEVSLRDFRQAYTDETFGGMLREASLTGALGNRGREG